MHAFLHELIPIRGRMTVNGVVSYASQEPWIFPATVRENILFGEQYDLDKYSEVIRVCGLLHDMDMFERGDQTMVGERGLKLSGGQKV